MQPRMMQPGQGGGGMGPPPNQPQNDMERKAIEDLLRQLRQKVGQPPMLEKKKPATEEVAVPADRARVVVRAPADAKLWVDQVECPLTGAVRSFDTPALAANEGYSYTLRIALQRNGQTIEETRRVPLTPGRQVEVDFSNVGAVRTAQN